MILLWDRPVLGYESSIKFNAERRKAMKTKTNVKAGLGGSTPGLKG
jgi:hypothetical protein